MADLKPQLSTRRVVFIMGVGHSGSTLLELILSSHSDVLGLGELAILQEKLDNGASDTPRLCSVCPDECELWNGRANISILRKYFSNRGRFSSLARRIYHMHKSIYHYFFEWFDASILVDSSKRVSWIQRQLQPAYHWRHIQPVLLYITRDGRAVVNSHLRKYNGTTVEAVVRNWKENVVRMEQFYQQFEWQKRMLSYETLAVNPYETARSLSSFLGLHFEPAMLHYWEHDHHPCNGNLGTRSLIYRYRSQMGDGSGEWDNSLEQLRSSHGMFYDRVGLAIKLDLRWKREMTEGQLRIFESIAGDTNRAYAHDTEPLASRQAKDPWSLISPG